MEKYVPPWTVRREFLTDALRPEHSGISADIMLFSDLGLSLAHHYKIHRFGLPHVTFRRDYMARLRALLPVPTVLPLDTVPPSGAQTYVSPRPTRRTHRQVRPVLVMTEAVGDLPILALQDPADVQGEVVRDCRPSLLPVSIPLSALDQ